MNNLPHRFDVFASKILNKTGSLHKPLSHLIPGYNPIINSSHPKETFLGMDLESGKSVFMNDKDRCYPNLIVGATGSGKSESVLLPMVYADAIKGNFSIVVDGKGDRSMLAKLSYYAQITNRPFFVFAPANQELTHTFNPLSVCYESRYLSAEQLSDILFNTYAPHSQSNGAADFYKKAQQKFMRSTFRLLGSMGKAYNFQDILRPMIDEGHIATLGKQAKTQEGLVAAEEMKAIARDMKDFAGIMGGLVTYLKAFDQWFINSTSPDINLEKMYYGVPVADGRPPQRPIVYFSLPVNVMPQMMRALGKLIISNITGIATFINNADIAEKRQCSVYIDEFQAFVDPDFADILARIRSSSFALHLLTQSTSDLATVSPHFQQQVLTNCPNKICMFSTDTKSAESFSAVVGHTPELEKNSRIEGASEVGEGSASMKSKAKIDPDLFTRLEIGQGIFIGNRRKFKPPLLQMPYLPDPPNSPLFLYAKTFQPKSSTMPSIFSQKISEKKLLANVSADNAAATYGSNKKGNNQGGADNENKAKDNRHYDSSSEKRAKSGRNDSIEPNRN